MKRRGEQSRGEVDTTIDTLTTAHDDVDAIGASMQSSAEKLESYAEGCASSLNQAAKVSIDLRGTIGKDSKRIQFRREKCAVTKGFLSGLSFSSGLFFVFSRHLFCVPEKKSIFTAKHVL